VSTESHVMALLEEGNPATEIPESAWAGTTASAYLATLNTRSSNVTRLDTKQAQETKGPRRPVGWIAAAIAAVVIGVAAFLVFQRAQDSPVVTEPPSTIGGAESFDGYWESTSQKLVIDGDTYWVVEDGGLVDTGQFQSGVSVIFTSGADSPSCAEGMVGVADVDWAANGQSFNTRLVSTDCASGFAFDEQFSRTEPFDIPDTPVAASSDGFDPALIGIWRLGTMEIEIPDDGSYVITRDGQVFDQGTYETAPGGSDTIPEGAEIILRASEDSPSCEPGDARSLTYEVAGTLAMQLHEDDCLPRLNAMLPWMEFTSRG